MRFTIYIIDRNQIKSNVGFRGEGKPEYPEKADIRGGGMCDEHKERLRRRLIFCLIRDNFNFSVFKATEQITKIMYKKLFGENDKICPQNEGKSISEHLKSKFSQGSMPPLPKGLDL